METRQYFCSCCWEYSWIEYDPLVATICPVCESEDIWGVEDEDDKIYAQETAQYFDDNFGHWDDMHDPDMQRFYHDVQRKSVEKECEGCGRTVRILPDYAYCDSCASKIEQGWEF